MKIVYVTLLLFICYRAIYACDSQACTPRNHMTNYFISSTSLEKIEQGILKACNEHTLVIFDVDDTLVKMDQSMKKSERECFSLLIQSLWGNCKKLKSREQAQLKFEKMMLPLVEKYSPTFISKLQQQQAKVIAITRSVKGNDESDELPNLMRWKFVMLSKLGIDFSNAFPLNIHKFERLGTIEDHPVFYKGILFAEPCSKSDVMKELLLRTVRWIPRNIIIVENSDSEAVHLTEAAESLRIDSLGVIYPRAVDSLSFNIFSFLEQVSYLMEHDEWLTKQQLRQKVAELLSMHKNQ